MVFYVNMTKENNFIKKLNLLDGVITYNDFDIDEYIPFKDQWYMYKEDILQVCFGRRFILDVGFYPSGNPNGCFAIKAILDNDWEHYLSKIKCCTLVELKNAIERTAIFINAMRAIKDIPYRTIYYPQWEEPIEINSDFIKNLNLFGGSINYCDFNIDATIPLNKQPAALHDSMLQIGFGTRFLVNVGGEDSHFIVRAIQDRDWSDPLFYVACQSLDILKEAIEKACSLVVSKKTINNLM